MAIRRAEILAHRGDALVRRRPDRNATYVVAAALSVSLARGSSTSARRAATRAAAGRRVSPAVRAGVPRGLSRVARAALRRRCLGAFDSRVRVRVRAPRVGVRARVARGPVGAASVRVRPARLGRRATRCARVDDGGVAFPRERVVARRARTRGDRQEYRGPGEAEPAARIPSQASDRKLTRIRDTPHGAQIGARVRTSCQIGFPLVPQHAQPRTSKRFPPLSPVTGRSS